MLERRREPRLSWNCTAPPSQTIQHPPRSADWGSRPQGPVGQVSRGLGARAPRAWGPAHQGPGAFSPQKPPNLSNYDFFANLLVGAWRRRGCRLKRLLRRWGPGGKRSRDTPPTPPTPRGFSPSPSSATIQHAPQGRRITLNSSFHFLFHYPYMTPVSMTKRGSLLWTNAPKIAQDSGGLRPLRDLRAGLHAVPASSHQADLVGR